VPPPALEVIMCDPADNEAMYKKKIQMDPPAVTYDPQQNVLHDGEYETIPVSEVADVSIQKT
ncbi:MAG TPA: hypothetical protein VEA18_01760, partial [Candidatus Kapabacteria bacterium]|nr:hypothetical protein [Candidatus Kapabacteria bacterium]